MTQCKEFGHILHLVDNARRKQLKWIEEILAATGWNQSRLAKEAGFSHATLSKFRNDPDNLAELDTRTVGKIAAVSPIPHYENVRGAMPAGFDAGEAEPYSSAMETDPFVARAIEASRESSNANAIGVWRLNTRALENVGYLPGDVLIVDAAATAKPGDAVIATIEDALRGGHEFVFRVYHKPYLVAASHQQRHLIPTLIDDRVEIRGVVVASIRPRLSRLAS